MVRSRKLTQDFGLDLIEVGILREGDQLRITMQRYSPNRELVCEKVVEGAIDIEKTVFDALRISGNPRKGQCPLRHRDASNGQGSCGRRHSVSILW